MNIAIITQPIEKNFGGVMQNFALQTTLRKMGHNPITIDYRDSMPLPFYLLVLAKSLLLWLIPSKRRDIPPYRNVHARDPRIENFVSRNIQMSPEQYYSYSPKAITENSCEAIVVGSDQVWRPRYNPMCLYDMFLRFAKGLDVKKIAYAASFGTNEWEYDAKQTSTCSALVQNFDAVSVRENSGVALCSQYLKVDAISVLDPTLLLQKKDYEIVCENIPVDTEKYVCAYILSNDNSITKRAEEFAAKNNLHLKLLKAEHSLSCSIEEWLAAFRDASYVLTDSFHGTVFSIVFQKPFFVIVNKGRGADRFHSLLDIYGLQDRILMEGESSECAAIDWSSVKKIHDELRVQSTNWLENKLQNL